MYPKQIKPSLRLIFYAEYVPCIQVSVHYTGKLKKNGKIFDSNVGRAPFKFRLGMLKLNTKYCLCAISSCLLNCVYLVF